MQEQANLVNPLAVKGGISEQLNVTIVERPNVQRKKRAGGCREAFRINAGQRLDLVCYSILVYILEMRDILKIQCIRACYIG